jgi:hypothetical protein
MATNGHWIWIYVKAYYSDFVEKSTRFVNKTHGASIIDEWAVGLPIGIFYEGSLYLKLIITAFQPRKPP